jgi:hypothetical protein
VVEEEHVLDDERPGRTVHDARHRWQRDLAALLLRQTLIEPKHASQEVVDAERFARSLVAHEGQGN